MQRSEFHPLGKQELDGGFVFVRVRFWRDVSASLRSSRSSVMLVSPSQFLRGKKSVIETEESRRSAEFFSADQAVEELERKPHKTLLTVDGLHQTKLRNL